MNQISKEEYKELVSKSKVCVLQYSEWGDVKSRSWKANYFNILNEPILVFTKKLPIIQKEFGYIPRGFLETENLELVLKELIEVVKRELDLTHLVIDPFIERSDNIKNIFKRLGFVSSGKTIQPNQTNIVDLDEDPWMDMKGNYRRNIKKSIREETKVEVHSEGGEAVDRFYKIMEAVFSRTDYIMYGIDYFRKVWSKMSESKLAKIYIATNNLEDVGAYLVVNDKEYVYELYGGVTNRGRDVEAGYLLKWEAIKDSKESGFKYYDHWGIAPVLSDGSYEKGHELENISKFKEGFGGKIIQYLTQQTYVYNNLGYKIYQLGLWKNDLVLKFKKRFS